MVPEVKTMAAVCLASISIQRQGCFPSARSALPSSRRLRQVSALLPFCSPSMANSRILSFPSGMLSQMGRQTSEAKYGLGLGHLHHLPDTVVRLFRVYAYRNSAGCGDGEVGDDPVIAVFPYQGDILPARPRW